MKGFPHIQLPPLQRQMSYALFALVGLSGIAWIALGFQLNPDDFSNPLRSWRHRLLITHGTAAYGLVWLLGTLFPRHQHTAWQARRNRPSGGVLSAALLTLTITGLMLYYPPLEDGREVASLVHQGVGLALGLLIPIHVLLGRTSRRAARPRFTLTGRTGRKIHSSRI